MLKTYHKSGEIINIFPHILIDFNTLRVICGSLNTMFCFYDFHIRLVSLFRWKCTKHIFFGIPELEQFCNGKTQKIHPYPYY